MSLAVRKLDGGTSQIDRAVLERLAGVLRGAVLTAETPGYDAARSVWNAMIDRKPAVIVRCLGAADVGHAVAFAREHGLLAAVRGGGHNIAGNAVCDGGLMIDLSGMRSVRIDPAKRTVRVEPGCTLGDLDRETQVFGLAVPVGINSTTGVAGLTLGGGFGWLTRKHGLTVDNLLEADVVAADGSRVVASDDRHPELFWALRGGGGNFGVVTSFEFRLHPVGPEVLSGLVVHPLAAGGAVLSHYRDFAADMPDELNVWAVLRKAPPLPFLPVEVHGTEVLVLACFYAGSLAEGERLLAPLRSFGSPIADVVGPHPYLGWQTAFDPLLTPGARNYWKSHNFVRLDDALLATILDHAGRLPSDHTEIFLGRLGGAANRIPADATAYPHRDAEFVMNVHGRWDDASDDARGVGWCREFFDASAPFATGGAYVNFLSQDEGERVRAAYGANYERLLLAKRRYDPSNLFRVNQNIRPA